ncbi:MAG: endolytic transglycosylase MltG [Ruminococcus sp.]|uniref:endolytic transglycosylase MltG n=1 Tax=Ruminococcus sp. TaxID=41978 RepID=UPI0025D398C1|nr:endolytic transglycosylase MltG [Ruminococcus sp.]MBO4867056.1 endolytic transglycosylase MltG [Ruminococcus sp.]
MSDKNFDIDDILGGSKENAGDASLNAEKPKKAEVDEIDELLASLKNRPRRRRPSEAENDNGEEKVSVPAHAPVPEEEPEAVIADEEEASEEPKEEKEAAIIGNDSDDIKKHFGKDADVEDEFDEDEDEDDEDEEDIPVRKASKSKSRSDEDRGSGKKRSGKSSGRKKKKGIGFNGSIFGGIILVTIILTVSLLLAVGGLTIGMEFYGIGKDEKDISFNIPEGSSNEDIADLLVENGIIKNKKLFLYTIKFMKPKMIYPGDITLQPSKPYSDIVEELEKQRESYQTVTVTFTEGEYLIDIAKKLEDNNVCAADDFLFEFNRDMGYNFESYLTDNKNAFYAREGYLFPDTYDFYVNDTAYNIAKVLRDHYDSKINDAMYKKMNDQGLSLNQTITLASIVQLEAANVEEMPRVASVFLNRLKDSDTFPMLQSDTTYNYINNVIKIKAGSEERVTHYTEYYDTYAMDGLPAGPICNPGIEAINAVLNPEKTDYYYFCNDIETGETFYAETLDEHEKNLVKAGRSDQVVEDTADNGNGNNEENDDENYNE